MYNEYFGFTESPFNVTSDPRFFYCNRHYQEAFTGLRWGIKLHQGLIVMTGEAGTGKTTLLRMIKEKFEPEIHPALILGPYPDFASLLQLMLVAFGLPKPPGGQLSMMRLLRTYLTEQLDKNHIVCALFDEAQEMDVRTLRELELLLDLEIENKGLLQIVLVGSSELETKLSHPELRSLKRRVALWSRLAPLQSSEVAPYIDHRVKRAGQVCENLFAPDAIEQIGLISRGIPRLINIMCDNGLLATYTVGQKIISRQTIQKVSYDLWLTRPSGPKAAVFSSQVEKLRNPAADDESEVKEEPQWSFAEVGLGEKDEPQRVRRVRKFGVLEFASVLVIFILGSTALLYFERSELSLSKNSDLVGIPQQVSEGANNKPTPGSIEEKSTSAIQMSAFQPPFAEQEFKPLPQKTVQPPQRTEPVPQKIVQMPQKASLAVLKSDEIGAKVFLHTLKEGDRAILEEIGVALRVKGYTIPETRLSSSRTQGDVRFFFSSDQQDAEKVKSIVESELARLGYRISLDVLERDGKKFQFAAPGKIEVWIPPLPVS